LFLLLGAMAVNSSATPAGQTPETDKKAVDVLRETIYQYERRRAGTPPPPTAATNPVVRQGTNGASIPRKSVPPTAAPPAANVPSKPAPARTPVIAEDPDLPRPGTQAELERLYLDGKITAKQFQKYLLEQERQAQTAAKTSPSKPSVSPPTRPTVPPAASAPAEQSTISEVEKKMDELIRLKTAREQATNSSGSATNATAAGPKTQRQQLDDLIRQYIEGKLTDAEYKERREKIISESPTK
jgi:hypothetical protein